MQEFQKFEIKKMMRSLQMNNQNTMLRGVEKMLFLASPCFYFKSQYILLHKPLTKSKLRLIPL
jgi:hypothetical protein